MQVPALERRGDVGGGAQAWMLENIDAQKPLQAPETMGLTCSRFCLFDPLLSRPHKPQQKHLLAPANRFSDKPWPGY